MSPRFSSALKAPPLALSTASAGGDNFRLS
jgi:hypothetical protein